MVIARLVSFMADELEKQPLAERNKRSAATLQDVARGVDFDPVERMVHDEWGELTGAHLLCALRAFDAYLDLYRVCCEPWTNERDASEREGKALRAFVAAAKVMKHVHAGPQGDIFYRNAARQVLLQDVESERFTGREGRALLTVGRLTRGPKARAKSKLAVIEEGKSAEAVWHADCP